MAAAGAVPVIIEAVLAVATVASTAVTVTETIQAGEQAKKAAQFKAKELEQQALEAQQSAAQQAAQQEQHSMAILSSIRAQSAASGVAPGAGSALETYDTSAEQAQLNEMYTKYAGNLAAQGTLSEAALTTYGGKLAETSSYYTAAGETVSGLGSLAKIGLSSYDRQYPQTPLIH